MDPRREHLAGARIDRAAGQLLEEEGDPAASLDDQATLGGVLELPVGQCGDQPGRLGLVKGFQLNVEDRRRPRRTERLPAGDEGHGAGDAPRGQEPQEVDGRRVGPVQVFDQHEARRRRSGVGEPGDQRPERLLTQGESVHLRSRPRSVAVQPEQRCQQGQGLPLDPGIVQPGLDLRQPRLGGLARVEAEQLFEHAADGPQGDIAVIGRTGRLEHGTALDVHVRRELRGQRRLPDAGDAVHDRHRCVGLRPSLRIPVSEAAPGGAQETALIRTTDQGDGFGEPVTGVGHGEVRSNDLVELHRAGDAPERARAHRLQLEVRLDELPGGVADDHRPGLGLSLQPRRHVGGRPREGRAVDDA